MPGAKIKESQNEFATCLTVGTRRQVNNRCRRVIETFGFN